MTYRRVTPHVAHRAIAAAKAQRKLLPHAGRPGKKKGAVVSGAPSISTKPLGKDRAPAT